MHVQKPDRKARVPSVRLVPALQINPSPAEYQDRRSRDRRLAFLAARRFGAISRRKNITRPMMNATQTTSGGVSAARSCHMAAPSLQPQRMFPLDLYRLVRNADAHFHRSGKRRNSMRVLPRVLGFTRSRSRNSATPSS